MSQVNELEFTQDEYKIIKHRYLNTFEDKLYASRIEDNKLLKEVLDLPPIHHTSNLAGDIKEEMYFDWSANEYLLDCVKEEFKKHVSRIYKQNVIDLTFMNPDRQVEYEQYIWSNYQKKNEYNPLHNHTGVLSFVYYPKIPEEIRQEYKGQTNNFDTRGLIEFVSSRHASDTLVMNPKSGDLFIFVATHRHQVYPFYNDVTRVSVAGNIYGILFDDASILGNFT
jgi:hypothetical protein